MSDHQSTLLSHRIAVIENVLGIGMNEFVSVNSSSSNDNNNPSIQHDNIQYNDVDTRITKILNETNNTLSSFTRKQQQLQHQQQQQGDASAFLLSTSNNLNSSSLVSDLEACQQLLSSLEPTGLNLEMIGLNMNNTSGADPSSSRIAKPHILPNVYRRQEVLARSQELSEAFESLSQIRDLIQMHNPRIKVNSTITDTESNNEDNSIEHTIISSPIFCVSNSNNTHDDQNRNQAPLSFASDPVNQKRLETLSIQINELDSRASKLTNRLDALLEVYYVIINSVNEKLRLANDSIDIESR